MDGGGHQATSRPISSSRIMYNTMQAIDHMDCAKKEQGWDSDSR
jgi:hypothetical protein